MTADGALLALRRSKTGPATVAVPRVVGHPLCPVAALERWLDLRGHARGPLWCRFSGRRPRAASVPDRGRRRLDAARVGVIVRRAVALAGEDPAAYSGHSLRAGLVTSAARAGVREEDIRQVTRHRSSALYIYVRPLAGPDPLRSHPVRAILQPGGPR